MLEQAMNLDNCEANSFKARRSPGLYSMSCGMNGSAIVSNARRNRPIIFLKGGKVESFFNLQKSENIFLSRLPWLLC